MDTTLIQKFTFILDRNLAKAYCTGNHVCTSCDKVSPWCSHIFTPAQFTVRPDFNIEGNHLKF